MGSHFFGDGGSAAPAIFTAGQQRGGKQQREKICPFHADSLPEAAAHFNQTARPFTRGSRLNVRNGIEEEAAAAFDGIFIFFGRRPAGERVMCRAGFGPVTAL